MSPEKLGYLPPETKKNYYLTDSEASVSSEQKLVSSTQTVVANNETSSKTTAEIEKNGENSVNGQLDHKTSELLLKIFARNSQESLTVPDSFKSFLRQYTDDSFLRNYLQESSLESNSAKRLQPLEPYRTRKSYQAYINDPFFLFLLYNRFYNNLHYDWQQKDESQQNGQAQSTEKILQSLGKALFDTRDRYESYVSSHVDINTGLLSRNTFEDYFTYLQNPAVQEKEQRDKLYGFAFVMIDLDHFKNINDTYGHVIGDEVLRKLSEAFKNNSEIRDGDAFFRYAGDEFSLIMPLTHGSSIKEVNRTIKERVFQRIAEILLPVAKEMQALSLSNQQTLNLTLSAGVHILSLSELQNSNDGENLREKIDKIVTQADQALYQAKTKRNSLSIKIEPETAVEEKDEKVKGLTVLEKLNQFFQRKKDQQENKDYTIIPLV